MTINGQMESIYLNYSSDRLKLKSIPNLGNVGWKSLYRAFYGAEELELVRGGDVSSVFNLGWTFSHARIADLQISNWDTSSVMMEYFLAGAWEANPDVSNWNTANVTSFYYAFGIARDFQPVVTNWDVSQATDFSFMFYRNKLDS